MHEFCILIKSILKCYVLVYFFLPNLACNASRLVVAFGFAELVEDAEASFVACGRLNPLIFPFFFFDTVLSAADLPTPVISTVCAGANTRCAPACTVNKPSSSSMTLPLNPVFLTTTISPTVAFMSSSDNAKFIAFALVVGLGAFGVRADVANKSSARRAACDAPRTDFVFSFTGARFTPPFDGFKSRTLTLIWNNVPACTVTCVSSTLTTVPFMPVD
mmetsp:Transcript_4974/g.18073  ORF Transcript_4974/g.18073 Transcript_4974/m.18073 type:complete len:218 (+) Transcript_4974:73-726(+)